MTKAGAGDWKTPLGYYERAIEELRRARKEFQAELQTLRELQASHATIKAELQANKTELQETKAELQAAKAELQATNERIKDLVTEAQKTADSARIAAKAAQDTANTARSEIGSIKARIENGAIVAQKALMLRGKDDNHWMRFSGVDSVNHHCFQVWRSDNTWHDDIRVKAATFLRARDDYHWMGFNYVKNGYDTFGIWKGDTTWHHRVRVGAAKKLRD